MNSPINELYKCKNGGELSADLCQKINSALAVIKIEDIPEDQRENVLDYLINSLNINSVQPDIVPALDSLRLQLQEITA